jgi:hypothetical protein
MNGNGGNGGGGGAAAPTPPVWSSKFAWGVGIVLAAAVYFLFGAAWETLWIGRAGMSEEAWNALPDGLRVAVSLATPLILLGGFLVAVGLWMAIVEWHGRFKVAETARPSSGIGANAFSGEDVGKVVDAISKLQGAVLVMVVGAVLMLSAAWVAQSAAEPAPMPSSTSSTETPAQ